MNRSILILNSDNSSILVKEQISDLEILGKSVLILNTHESINKPIMTDLSGKEMKCPAFTIDKNVEVKHSCAVTFKGRFIVYGGSTHKRQIAQVTNKSLKNVGTLSFDFVRGGCTSTTNEILLCFHVDGDLKTCYQTTIPTNQFKKITKSSQVHRRVKFASSECKLSLQSPCLV